MRQINLVEGKVVAPEGMKVGIVAVLLTNFRISLLCSWSHILTLQTQSFSPHLKMHARICTIYIRIIQTDILKYRL